jgi:proteasomal ATPase-associated factor 1
MPHLSIHFAGQPTKITTFDVSPDGLQIATGYDDGTVICESTSTPTKKFQNVTPKVHVAYVSSLRFFPSSRVLLTAGADFTLHILPAEQVEAPAPVTPVRALKGHTRVITDTAIVSKGRNVLSSAKVRRAHSYPGTKQLHDNALF